VSTSAAWWALAALGAFHGLNPAMGWLFAAARGLQQRSRMVVLRSMIPIAAGHALSIAIVVAVVAALHEWIDFRVLATLAAAILIAFGIYRLFARHRGRVGMQVNAGELLLWSFVMATAHGAGLMLVPVLLNMTPPGPHSTHATMAMHSIGAGAATALAAVVVHTLSMLAVATTVAVVVYEWVGVAFLRRGWINFDFVWSGALVFVGLLLLVEALTHHAS
jgi:hypothetical protein